MKKWMSRLIASFLSLARFFSVKRNDKRRQIIREWSAPTLIAINGNLNGGYADFSVIREELRKDSKWSGRDDESYLEDVLRELVELGLVRQPRADSINPHVGQRLYTLTAAGVRKVEDFAKAEDLAEVIQIRRKKHG